MVSGVSISVMSCRNPAIAFRLLLPFSCPCKHSLHGELCLRCSGSHYAPVKPCSVFTAPGYKVQPPDSSPQPLPVVAPAALCDSISRPSALAGLAPVSPHARSPAHPAFPAPSARCSSPALLQGPGSRRRAHSTEACLGRGARGGASSDHLSHPQSY